MTPRREDVELSHATRSRLGALERALADPAVSLSHYISLVVEFRDHLVDLPDDETVEAVLHSIEHTLSCEAGRPLHIYGYGFA